MVESSLGMLFVRTVVVGSGWHVYVASVSLRTGCIPGLLSASNPPLRVSSLAQTIGDYCPTIQLR